MKDPEVQPSTFKPFSIPASVRPYLRAVRPRMGLFAIVWTVAGYSHFGARVTLVAFVTILTVGLLTCGIVLLNDYCDRSHDQKKGRTLASEHPRNFLVYTITLWLLVGYGIFVILRDNLLAGGALAIIAVLGVFYSWFRRVPMLSAATVGACYGGLAVVAAAVASRTRQPDALWGGIAVAVFVFVRETLYDLEDRSIDAGYKHTLPVLIGPVNAQRVSAVCLIIALVLALVVSPWMFVLWIAVPWQLWWLIGPTTGLACLDSVLDAQAMGFIIIYALTSFAPP